MLVLHQSPPPLSPLPPSLPVSLSLPPPLSLSLSANYHCKTSKANLIANTITEVWSVRPSQILDHDTWGGLTIALLHRSSPRQLRKLSSTLGRPGCDWVDQDVTGSTRTWLGRPGCCGWVDLGILLVRKTVSLLKIEPRALAWRASTFTTMWWSLI